MTSSLLNLAQRINKIKCKYRHKNEICETCGIKYKACKWCLEYARVKDDLMVYKCLCCNKTY